MAKNKKNNDNNIFYIALIVVLAIVGFIFGYDSNFYGGFRTFINDTFGKEIKEVESLTDDVKVYFLDVGEADAILIDSNGKYVLIDSGNNEDGNNLVSYMKEVGVERLEYVIGTHAHEDHIGSMSYIIKKFDIDHYIMPSTKTDYNSYTYTIKALDKKEMGVEEPKIDSIIKLDEVSCKYLYYDNNEEDLNNNSIIMKCTFFNNSYLFTGDTTSDVEKMIFDKDLKSDVLKIAHHGSRYSSSAQFLEKVNPKYAIITCEEDNEYGYPHKVTLDKLNSKNIKIFRTDYDGTIISTSDGNNISFNTIKTNTNG
jgi:competence protein ComEC